jgi:hypothetical protein
LSPPRPHNQRNIQGRPHPLDSKIALESATIAGRIRLSDFGEIFIRFLVPLAHDEDLDLRVTIEVRPAEPGLLSLAEKTARIMGEAAKRLGLDLKLLPATPNQNEPSAPILSQGAEVNSGTEREGEEHT